MNEQGRRRRVREQLTTSLADVAAVGQSLKTAQQRTTRIEQTMRVGNETTL
jgi:hypothetical protein